jgi:hypothetical protein
MHAREVNAHETRAIRCTLVGGGTYRIDDTFSDGVLNDDEVLEDTVSRNRECSIRRFGHYQKHQVWSRNKKTEFLTSGCNY